MTEAWNFINTGGKNPYYNMAMDEALLNFVSRGEVDPVTRSYIWSPTILSTGYSRRLQKEIDIDKAKEKGFGLVGRQTGDYGVLHDRELTYNAIVPESHPNMSSTVTEVYKVISRGLSEGSKSLGLDTYFAVPKMPEERQKLK